MDKIEFQNIHHFLLDHLNIEFDNTLEKIGFWYFKFLESDIEKLTLHVPEFNNQKLGYSFDYLRLFSFIYYLSKLEIVDNYSNKCLFDIFNYSKNKSTSELILEYNSNKEHLALWGEDVLTRVDSFLPVFNKERLLEFKNPTKISQTFDVFKSIAKKQMLNYPIEIDLTNRFVSFNNVGTEDTGIISETQFLVDEVPNKSDFDDQAMDLEEELEAEDYQESLQLKYPYSKQPHPYLIDKAKKNFKLHFHNRFSYHEIKQNDLFLLNGGDDFLMNLDYQVIPTGHSKNLFELLSRLREQWVDLDINKFTTPFPKYWFLFLNNSQDKNKWINQYKSDFPAISRNPIIQLIEEIIEEIINLNWIDNLLTDSTKIFFPELKSHRKKRLEYIFTNFKKYVQQINPNVVFLNSLDESKDLKDVIILDPFNIIQLANLSQKFPEERIKLFVPDFLYYGYQPWIRYHLFNFKHLPLVEGVRKEIDFNYDENKSEFERLRHELISDIKSEFRAYKKQFSQEVSLEIDENLDSDDLEFDNVEETELIHSETNKRNVQSVLINGRVRIDANERLLLQRDSMLYVEAFFLKIGDLFLRKDDVRKVCDSSFFFDKLVNIPDNVKNYQKSLGQIPNIYKKLKMLGISYAGESYFNDKYALDSVNEHNFRIPRRKNDWSIICDYLGINSSEEQLSFIAYYGRRRQNELKQMYLSIIENLLENDLLGEIDNPLVLNLALQELKRHTDIFKIEEDTDLKELAESVVLTIFSELKLIEVKSIIYE